MCPEEKIMKHMQKTFVSPSSNTDEKGKDNKNGYCKAFCVIYEHNNLESDLKCCPPCGRQRNFFTLD